MRRQVKVAMAGIVAAMALVACASTGPAAGDAAARGSLSASSDYTRLAANAAGERKICRQQSVTGSNIQTREVCMTRAQFLEERERARQQARDLQLGQELMPRQMPEPAASASP